MSGNTAQSVHARTLRELRENLGITVEQAALYWNLWTPMRQMIPRSHPWDHYCTSLENLCAACTARVDDLARMLRRQERCSQRIADRAITPEALRADWLFAPREYSWWFEVLGFAAVHTDPAEFLSARQDIRDGSVYAPSGWVPV